MGDAPDSPTVTRPRGALLNVLGLAFGVSVIVGGSIGVGILKQPGVVAANLPHPALFLAAWVVGGGYVLLGALSVAELAAMTPRSGGFYVYTRRALGEYGGFVAGWAHWLALLSGAAFIYLQLAEYAARVFPALVGGEHALAVGTVVGLAALHWRSVRRAGRIQELTTLAKGVAFLALIVAFLALGDPAATATDASPLAVPTGVALLAGFVLAFSAILQTYDGWEGSIYFGEEVRDPGRNLPRSLIVGTLAVVVIYFFVNLSLLYVLPFERIAGHPMAVAAAAEGVFGSAGGKIVFALGTLSILVACNAGTLQTPRVLYAMSRDGLFFPAAARVNAGGTPTVSLAVTTAGIVLFLLFGGSIPVLLDATAFFLVALYTLTFAAVFVLRWREPAAPRPFRAWGYPVTPALALLGSLVYLGSWFWTADAERRLAALVILAGSVPVFGLVKWARGPRQPLAA